VPASVRTAKKEQAKQDRFMMRFLHPRGDRDADVIMSESKGKSNAVSAAVLAEGLGPT
jgi:hypothetical protein